VDGCRFLDAHETQACTGDNRERGRQPEPARELELELVHGSTYTEKNRWSATGSTKDDETEGEIAEKEEELTARTRACSGKSKEDLTDRISPAIGDEEEDAPVAAVSFGSIP
jgi:hypothetical protein